MASLLLAFIYLAFVSLGLPDAVLGSAWPSMYPGLGVPVSYAGIISMIISSGTVVSALMSDRLTRRFGAGRVTAVSVAVTALALLGFSVSGSFIVLCLIALPYGLGAGSVDAALNNYVAIHYESRHMSWLHCMWGLGASLGPFIMSWALTSGSGWPAGYRAIGLFQVALSAALLLSLPLWRRCSGGERGEDAASAPVPYRRLLRADGVGPDMLAFFCYCGLEQTAGLWAASYLVLHGGVDEDTAAGLASMFYLGITLGRLLSGFLTSRFDDTALPRLGYALTAASAAALLLPLGTAFAAAALLLLGMGCAPVYPCYIHATPARFGADRSQAVMGLQMASAFFGSTLVPPVFGFIARRTTFGIYPFYILAFLLVMLLAHTRLERLRPCRAKA